MGRAQPPTWHWTFSPFYRRVSHENHCGVWRCLQKAQKSCDRAAGAEPESCRPQQALVWGPTVRGTVGWRIGVKGTIFLKDLQLNAAMRISNSGRSTWTKSRTADLGCGWLWTEQHVPSHFQMHTFFVTSPFLSLFQMFQVYPLVI